MPTYTRVAAWSTWRPPLHAAPPSLTLSLRPLNLAVFRLSIYPTRSLLACARVDPPIISPQARLNATHGHVVRTHSAEDEALVPGAASGLRSKGYPPPVDTYGDRLEAPRSLDYSRWSPPSSLPSNRTGHSADSAAFGRSGREQRWAPLLRQAGEGTGGGGTGGGAASLLERLVGAPRGHGVSGHADDDGSR
mmetsp:Transcript_6850/g.22519  ORF Transcript_6850/g.22519 Transcript_6850/m.22519 type:complete len:192 (+) Transcript_6850:790-1365(+)